VSTIPAKFALIWFSGFRGEDLNVIFYQNMSNLYNRYKSVEGKISQKNPPFQYCVRQPRPPFKMAAVTKNRNSLIVYCFFIISQNELSSLTFLSDFRKKDLNVKVYNVLQRDDGHHVMGKSYTYRSTSG
jgi:hypothetical protein